MNQPTISSSSSHYWASNATISSSSATNCASKTVAGANAVVVDCEKILNDHNQGFKNAFQGYASRVRDIMSTSIALGDDNEEETTPPDLQETSSTSSVGGDDIHEDDDDDLNISSSSTRSSTNTTTTKTIPTAAIFNKLIMSTYDNNGNKNTTNSNSSNKRRRRSAVVENGDTDEDVRTTSTLMKDVAISPSLLPISPEKDLSQHKERISPNPSQTKILRRSSTGTCLLPALEENSNKNIDNMTGIKKSSIKRRMTLGNGGGLKRTRTYDDLSSLASFDSLSSLSSSFQQSSSITTTNATTHNEQYKITIKPISF